MPQPHVEASDVPGAEIRPNKETGTLPGLGGSQLSGKDITKRQDHFSDQVIGEAGGTWAWIGAVDGWPESLPRSLGRGPSLGGDIQAEP